MINDFYNFKKDKKIVMITCYNWYEALIISKTDIDAVLVGDSLAMTVYGYDSTIYATPQMMIEHTKAVKKGLSNKMIITDMPFISFRMDKYFALKVASEFIKAGADAVKIEGIDGHEDTISHIIQSGIPVMGHLGITPQYIKSIGKFSRKGKEDKEIKKLINDAKKLQSIGCFSIILECVMPEVAERITNMLKIPVIGIGSGEKTDGQIIVIHDILGLYPNSPSFAQKYDDISTRIKAAIEKYVKDVRNIK